jgi:ABC-type uncharacterized transport system auxiliary subunit
MKNVQANRARLPVLAAALALAAVLGACHHHDDDDDNNKPKPPPVATDAFIAYVSQIVATSSDTAEPASTDGVTVTEPDNTEPQPLPAS